MSIITSQNWDTVTPPAIPSGWNVGTGLVTTSSGRTSTPNSLGSSSVGFSGTSLAMWGTADSNSGNVAVQSSLYLGADGSANRWGLFARANKSPLINSSMFYTLWLENLASPSSPALSITLTDHGIESALTGATVSIGGSITGGWYTAFLVISGGTLTGSLQRQSDGAWLATNGSWGASQVTAISVLDSSLTGSGYAGILLNGTLAGTMYSDDFVLSTAASPVSATPTPVAVAGTGILGTETSSIDWALSASAILANGVLPTVSPQCDFALGTTTLIASALLSATSAGYGTTSIVAAIAGSSTLPAETILQGWAVTASPVASGGLLATAALATAMTLPESPLSATSLLPAATQSLDEALSANSQLSGTGSLANPTTVLGMGASLLAGLPFSGTGSLLTVFASVGFGVGITPGPFFSGIAAEPSASIAYDFSLTCGGLSTLGGLGMISLQVQGMEIAAVLALTSSGAFSTANALTSQSGVVYNVYVNDGSGGPINYSNPIATTSGTSWTSGTLTKSSDWKFGVRAYQLGNSLEEQNLDAAIELILDASGVDISATPMAPSGLRAIPRAAGAIRVEWGFHSMARARLPLGFHVYIGVGGTPNYASPAASANYVLGCTSYLSDLTGLVPGTTYTIGVRSYNAAGEETNSSTVLITSDATGPQGVDILTATPTAIQGA